MFDNDIVDVYNMYMINDYTKRKNVNNVQKRVSRFDNRLSSFETKILLN